MLVVLIVAIALRLKGIHTPILDHPAWRQGDTASIARNFALLQFNILYPQTNYNGPPPNYVELELQIVPFLAATLYKIFGVHEIFGRLITLAFSVGTVGVIGLFGRWLFSSWVAGLCAAFLFAVFPGSVYYGRTFTPDTTMVFFLTAALYSVTRFLIEDELLRPRALARCTALLMMAFLAKPVAVAGLVPVIGVVFARVRTGRPTRPTALIVLLLIPLLILSIYDQRVAEHAEWHWASGITKLHVIPELQRALTSVSGFSEKWSQFVTVLGMLRMTMLGTVSSLLSIAAFVALPWIAVRSRALLWGWLIGGIAYTYAVVTVERVDYYMYLLLPLCALVIGGMVAHAIDAVNKMKLATPGRYAIFALFGIVAVFIAIESRAAVRPYYAFNKQAYRNATYLDRTLDKNALVVIGHYGPDVLYYMNRYGWEEDPALWTPFDEESAIKKGARYFVSIEDNRLRRNTELCAWLQRFPVLNERAEWPVYVTDPARMSPGAEALWRAFRDADRKGAGREFLNDRGLCKLSQRQRVLTALQKIQKPLHHVAHIFPARTHDQMQFGNARSRGH